MNARDAALVLLQNRTLPNWRPRPLHRSRLVWPEDHRDRALAEQIYNGVIKNLLLLQYLAQHYSNRPLKKIDPLALQIVVVGLYQLRFLTRIPPSAAVDESVKQTKRFGPPRISGFVNAVLRNATREPNPPLPTAEQDPAHYAEVVLSHPPELFARLVDVVGVVDALRICAHDNNEPPTIVRLFPGVDVCSLDADGVTIAPHEQAGMFVVTGAKQATLADWANRGTAQVQDPTAARVVPEACDVSAGQTLLDRCAGLGTKTLQLRELVGDAGRVFAVDASAHRIAGLRRICQRRNLKNVHPVHGSMLKQLPGKVPDTFDCILVDAPCSNSGVLARRPEARYAQDGASLQSLAKLQQDILDDTAQHVARGGRFVYSTCSIWPEENEGRVAEFLKRHPAFSLVNERVTLPSMDDETTPSRYHDGGYYAVLSKSTDAR
jgi:16S rRNA (cytosine967-C5)-methyltransferase